jgi:hypothetical protein
VSFSSDLLKFGESGRISGDSSCLVDPARGGRVRTRLTLCHTTFSLPSGRAESTSPLSYLRRSLLSGPKRTSTACYHRGRFGRGTEPLPADGSQEHPKISRLNLHSNNEPIYPNSKFQTPDLRPQMSNFKSRIQTPYPRDPETPPVLPSYLIPQSGHHAWTVTVAVDRGLIVKTLAVIVGAEPTSVTPVALMQRQALV